MASVAAQLYEYRCNGCWQTNYISTDKAGETVCCVHCAKESVAPEVTEDRIDRAQQAQEEGADQLLSQEERAVNPKFAEYSHLSDADLERIVRIENSYDGELDYQGYPAAPLVLRLFAKIIDNMIATVAFAIGAGCAFLLAQAGMITFDEYEIGVMDMVIGGCALLFVPFVYHLFYWNLVATRGQSPGKMLCCLRIVSVPEGHPGGFLRSVVIREWVVGLLHMIPLFGIINILVVFSDASRCLHDYISGTRVVQA